LLFGSTDHHVRAPVAPEPVIGARLLERLSNAYGKSDEEKQQLFRNFRSSSCYAAPMS
jgi:hypothetical protein